MTVGDTLNELLVPTFNAVADSELKFSEKRNIMYTLYAFACAIEPEYAFQPDKALFEFGCCFLVEPHDHPEYAQNKDEFDSPTHDKLEVAGGGSWYVKDGKTFIKFDALSELFTKMKSRLSTAERAPIEIADIVPLVYGLAEAYPELQPVWFTYFFYIAPAINAKYYEVLAKLKALCLKPSVYKAALALLGSTLIGDEAELSGDALLSEWYGGFIKYRRDHLEELFSEHINKGDNEFVAKYTGELLKTFSHSLSIMTFNIAARVELAAKNKDFNAVKGIIADCKEYLRYGDAPAISRYLALSEAVLLEENPADGEI